jgi:hypothetical protein
LVCSESSWRTRIARGLSVKRWGTAAVAAPAAGYAPVAAGGRLVAIGNITVAYGYSMLLASGHKLVAAGRQLEDRPLPGRRTGGRVKFGRSTLRTRGAFGLAGVRPI